MPHTLTIEQATDLAIQALTTSGASRSAAESVARSVVNAHALGRTNVGLSHLPFYCDALRRGALDGQAEPVMERARPGLLQSDARTGFTHYAFDRAFETFTGLVWDQGVGMLTIRNTYTCGCLGYFPDRLAREGFVALAATNAGPAAVAPSGAEQPVFSTNPLALGFPRPGSPPLLIDQSSSACTLVDVHAARDRGDPIPGDWALDGDGRPTTDPDEALRGSFRPFGGYKGSNIALMVELLAAGLSGGNWSIDAPSFAEGPDSPGVGQWFLAIDIEALPEGTLTRTDHYLSRVAGLGVHLPGAARHEHAERAQSSGLSIPEDLYRRIQTCCRPG